MARRFKDIRTAQLLFDFGTEYNAENGTEWCRPLDQSCQNPNQPPYNEEYMKKGDGDRQDRGLAVPQHRPKPGLPGHPAFPRAGAPNFSSCRVLKS